MENSLPKLQCKANQESSSDYAAFTSSSSSSPSTAHTDTGDESSSLSAVLAELNLKQFLEGFLSEGYETSVDLAEINTAQVEQVCANIGMQSGHTLRFCRWVR